MSDTHYLYRVRCQSEPQHHPDAFVKRGPQGLLRWTCQETAILPLADAERLKADAAHALGGTLYLEPVEKTFRTCTPY